MPFTAICVRCGRAKNATAATDDGWRLMLGNGYGGSVNAMCWRCDRTARAAAMSSLTDVQATLADAMLAERDKP